MHPVVLADDHSRIQPRPPSPSRMEVRPWLPRAATQPQQMHVDYSTSSIVTHPRQAPDHAIPRSLSSQTILPALNAAQLSPIQSPSDTSTPSTPPVTPRKFPNEPAPTETMTYAKDTFFDFSRIDYELDRARCLGRGLWSSVYLAEPIVESPKQPIESTITPPSSPQRPSTSTLPLCRLFAVKTPARPDSNEIFTHEAKMLAQLQTSPRAQHFIVPFHGLDPRNSSIVLEGVIGGSLEDLSTRLKVLTELARHLELRRIFPTMATDLIHGLAFIHSTGIVHADVKPANILLDIVSDDLGQHPTLRARYIDFSASFVLAEGGSANAGGTWDYMAPEQLRIQKDLNQPTFASDVWSVGITLLSLLVGGSPYTAACGDNVFMRREAIKSADPLGFARMDPVVQKRMAACHDFLDCCRLALQKDRSRRCTAEAWEAWIRRQSFVVE